MPDIPQFFYNDTSGDLERIVNELGHETEFLAYDAHGRPTRSADANGLITELGYDARGRVASRVVDPGGDNLTTTFSYTAAGPLDTVTLPDGSSLSYEYDDAKCLIELTDNLSNRMELVRTFITRAIVVPKV